MVLVSCFSVSSGCGLLEFSWVDVVLSGGVRLCIYLFAVSEREIL